MLRSVVIGRDLIAQLRARSRGCEPALSLLPSTVIGKCCRSSHAAAVAAAAAAAANLTGVFVKLFIVRFTQNITPFSKA